MSLHHPSSKREIGQAEHAALLMALLCVLFLAGPRVIAEWDDRGASTPASEAAPDLKNVVPGLRAGGFLENAGQLDNPGVLFYTVAGNMQVGFTDGAVLIGLAETYPTAADLRDTHALRNSPPDPAPSRAVAVRFSFEGANDVTPHGRNPLPYSSHFFLGSDPLHWRTDVRTYSEIVYERLYPGVDLVYRLAPTGLKYDLHVAAGSDLNAVVLSASGLEDLVVTETGGLRFLTAAGEIVDSAPIADQGSNALPCSFELRSPRSFGFACPGVDASRPFIVDPLLYSTYLGASGDDYASAVAVDSSGSAYVSGSTYSPDFPATVGAYNTSLSGNSDVFLARLDPTGSSLLYASYLGGSFYDSPASVAVDPNGNAFVTGTTFSPDFPTTAAAFDRTCGSDGNCDIQGPNFYTDAFVAKFDPTGSTLLYSTYLGGNQMDVGGSLAVDAAGNAYVPGSTNSTDFPTTPGVLDRSINGLWDMFIVQLDASGSSLVYGTFCGGSANDSGVAVAVDAGGNVTVTGSTESADFPTTPGAFDRTISGFDAFVTRLDSSGSALLYSTFLGGGDDEGLSIAVDTAGNAYVAGHTDSNGFPVTPGAFDTTDSFTLDAFVAKLDPAGSALLYATYLGGSGDEFGYDIAVDASGGAFVSGFTTSMDFPAPPDAYDTILGGFVDAFVASFDPSGAVLLNGTYLGGIGDEYGESLAIDAAGNVYVVGETDSVDFPTTPGALDETANGGYEAFVSKVPLGALGAAPPSIVSATLSGPGLQDLDLTWTPAAGDGAPGGPSDYRVLRAPTLGGPFVQIGSVPATGSPSYTYTCPLCGHVLGDTNTTFYRIRAFSSNWTADSNLAARYAKAVQTGPHLLTIPLEQTDYAIPVVLQTVTHGTVRTYQAANAVDPWKAWYPGRWGDLPALEFGEALWVDVTAIGQYTLAGLVRTNHSFVLSSGWNLVGYASFVEESMASSLAGVAVARVETFGAPLADPYRLRVLVGLEMLVPGDAYWVQASAGGLWVQG